MTSDTAKKRWEFENRVKLESDEIYRYDKAEQDSLRAKAPWLADPHYFKNVRISSVALLKLVLHARSGCAAIPGTAPDYEVMGLLLGKIEKNTIIVTDAFGVVQGNEIRVNAGAGDFEYMVQYTTTVEQVGKTEPVVGWYHSHPGYGCWLSGIDVNTQLSNQEFQDPYLGIVVDPKRTMSSGKVDIGAFRTYPRDYKPPNAQPSEYQSVPLDKIEDFGVHANAYYQLNISVFKSSLDTQLFDLLWDKYWVKTLSSSPTLANRDFSSGQIRDLAGKLEKVDKEIAQQGMSHLFAKKKDKSELAKVTHDSSKVCIEQVHGILNEVVKHSLFNFNPREKSTDNT